VAESFEDLLARTLREAEERGAQGIPPPACVHCQKPRAVVRGGICLPCLLHDLGAPCPDREVEGIPLAEAALSIEFIQQVRLRLRDALDRDAGEENEKSQR
jgi:hypothetical protein